MKTVYTVLICAIAVLAAPVRVTFDAPVTRGEVLHKSATINYIYIDTDYLDVYSSIGSVRMCYPAADSTASCAVRFSLYEVSQPAHAFIKATVPTKFKSWAEEK